MIHEVCRNASRNSVRTLPGQRSGLVRLGERHGLDQLVNVVWRRSLRLEACTTRSFGFVTLVSLEQVPRGLEIFVESRRLVAAGATLVMATQAIVISCFRSVGVEAGIDITVVEVVARTGATEHQGGQETKRHDRDFFGVGGGTYSISQSSRALPGCSIDWIRAYWVSEVHLCEFSLGIAVVCETKHVSCQVSFCAKNGLT